MAIMTTGEKMALIGFRYPRFFPVTANTDEEYKVGPSEMRLYGVSLQKQDTKAEYNIYADDMMYASGDEYSYTDHTLVTPELDPAIEKELAGASYDDTTETYSFGGDDIAPEYALTYCAPDIGKEFMMFMHPCVKLRTVQVQYQTKGENVEVANYTLTLRGTVRPIDRQHTFKKRSVDRDLDWLTDPFKSEEHNEDWDD